MAVAVFDYAQWAAHYPLLSPSVDEAQATYCFSLAEFYLDNTDCSPVTDIAKRLLLLEMLVAHIALLTAVINGNDPSGLVGRITDATEGTAKVSVNAASLPGSAEWYAQTTYGLMVWQALAGYRTMHYVPGPEPIFDSFGIRGWSWPR